MTSNLLLNFAGLNINCTDIPFQLLRRVQAQYRGFAGSGPAHVSARLDVQLEDIKLFDQALRKALSGWLPPYNGCLIHGAAIEEQGRGYLFVGPSDAGKSTVAEISRRHGCTVLTDELPAIRIVNGQPMLFATPFVGEQGGLMRHHAVPLSGVFLLEQSGEDRPSDLKPANAVREVMQSVMNFSTDRAVNQQLLDLIFELHQKQPVRRLRFTRSAAFLAVIKNEEEFGKTPSPSAHGLAAV